MSGPLASRTALVTGGTRGLGAAIVATLASQGAAVMLTGRSAKDAKSVAERIASHTGGKVRGVGWDADCDELPRQVDAVVDSCAAELGSVDILVNNAGTIRRGWAIDLDSRDWQKVLRVNLTAPLLMCQSAARLMRDAGGGTMINVASILAFSTGRRVVGYTTSKAALVQLTRALAVEWADIGINVNAVAAGYCETAMTAPLRGDADLYGDTLARIPMSRWANAEEIAAPVAFLCSSAASYITGAVLAVDGGWGAV
jgi:2-dehydro-3-deoxy-D-gluconate 5-dehydrogenase